MAKTAQQVIDSARIPWNDANKIRYLDLEALGYLNDGMLALLMLKPDLFVKVGDLICVVGTCDQTLPAGATTLVDIYNVKNGRGVSRTTINALRSFRPNWRSDTAGPCQNWCYDPEGGGTGYIIYPQAPAQQILTGAYVMTPTPLAIGDALTVAAPNIPDNYSVPLQHYVTARGEMKDDEHVNSGRMQAMLSMFSDMVAQADKEEANP